MTFHSAVIACAAISLFSCSRTPESGKSPMTLSQQIARFAPTSISADMSVLAPGDRAALDKILAAARLMDELYFRQVWDGNADLLKKLRSDTSAAGKERLHYFLINLGPWSLLDANAPFVQGAPAERPLGANYYPHDLTKEEFETWLTSLAEADRVKATGFFHTIRRDAAGKLRAVPYSTEYRAWLEPAAALLREAAALTTNKSLRQFLTLRAQAFMNDDYYASDIAWMMLDSPIDVTIGPYETYMDELFSYKAAFEAFVTLRDDKATAKLARFSSYLQEIENNLPIDPKYRNPRLGALAPIRVVDVVYTSGEGNRGVQTAAFNLPNDERVVREQGTKRVMLKNVQEAKFNKVLTPIATKVLSSTDGSSLSFDAFFTHILAHELMHGLGPHGITVGGTATTVRQELKELYSAIEEAKADVMGLFALQFLIDKGLVEKQMECEMYITFLASMFRSVRFGINEAHGKGVAIQFNSFVDAGAIHYNGSTKTFSVDLEKMKQSVHTLTAEILTLQAEGSYAKAKTMIDTYAVIRPVMKSALDALGNIPVDIEPQYPMAPSVPGALR
jgi:hypothetical protein